MTAEAGFDLKLRVQTGWIVPLFHPQYLIASTDRVEGFRRCPTGSCAWSA